MIARDPVTFLAARARHYAQLGRNDWREHGGALRDCIDRRMDEFAAELEAMRGPAYAASPPTAPLALPALLEATEP